MVEKNDITKLFTLWAQAGEIVEVWDASPKSLHAPHSTPAFNNYTTTQQFQALEQPLAHCFWYRVDEGICTMMQTTIGY